MLSGRFEKFGDAVSPGDLQTFIDDEPLQRVQPLVRNPADLHPRHRRERIDDAVEDQLAPDFFFHRVADAPVESARRQRLRDVAAPSAGREQGMARCLQRHDTGCGKDRAEVGDPSDDETPIADETCNDVLAMESVLETDDCRVGRNEIDDRSDRRLGACHFRREQDDRVALDRAHACDRLDGVNGFLEPRNPYAVAGDSVHVLLTSDERDIVGRRQPGAIEGPDRTCAEHDDLHGAAILPN